MFQNYSLQIAIVVFFVTVIVSRLPLMNALQKLSDEDKAKLLSTGMIKQSQTRMLLAFAVLGVYYFAIVKYPEYARELLTAFAIIIIVSRLIYFFITKKKLETQNFPSAYIRAFTISSFIYNFGILIFFFLLIKNFL